MYSTVCIFENFTTIPTLSYSDIDTINLVKNLVLTRAVSLRYDNWCTVKWAFIVKKYLILRQFSKTTASAWSQGSSKCQKQKKCTRSEISINLSFYVYIIPKRNNYSSNSNKTKGKYKLARVLLIDKLLITSFYCLNILKKSLDWHH
jgi:hypothetical protein